VGTLGGGLVATARSEDGVVEAVELPGHRFVVGVQWHPEESGDQRLFDALIAATRKAEGAGLPDVVPADGSRG
jgi:gamma-glutamyl-gamma-aminobutyrate hydrolase PuuD